MAPLSPIVLVYKDQYSSLQKASQALKQCPSTARVYAPLNASSSLTLLGHYIPVSQLVYQR